MARRKYSTDLGDLSVRDNDVLSALVQADRRGDSATNQGKDQQFSDREHHCAGERLKEAAGRSRKSFRGGVENLREAGVCS